MSQFAAISIPGYGGHIPGHVAENILSTSFAKANQLSLTARRGYDSDVEAHFRAARHSRNHSDGARNIAVSMKRRGENEACKGRILPNPYTGGRRLVEAS